MILRNLIFKTEVVKQRLRAGMVSHHEQQASKCHGEQQHRELWPAYNANVAPSQASTEGLFQQTRLFTSIILSATGTVRPPQSRLFVMEAAVATAVVCLCTVMLSAQHHEAEPQPAIQNIRLRASVQ